MYQSVKFRLVCLVNFVWVRIDLRIVAAGVKIIAVMGSVIRDFLVMGMKYI